MKHRYIPKSARQDAAPERIGRLELGLGTGACRTFTCDHGQFGTCMPDDNAMMTGVHGTKKVYKIGTANEAFTKLLNELLSETR